MHRFQVAALFAITVLVACGGGRNSEPTEAAIGELRIVAGAGVSDTVQARPLQALVVEVREGGHPRPGLIVYFQTLPTADTTRRFESTILTSNIAANSFGTLTSDTTDASGRASVLVQLGTVAGDAGLRVSSPELGLADTVHVTVLPSIAKRIVMTALDAEVAFGGSYDIGAAAADRFGNRRSDAMTFSSASPLATVDAAGNVRASQEIGRGVVIVSSGSIVDTARFTVIPRVDLAFVYLGETDTWIADGKTDGTSIRTRIRSPSPGYPSPSPTSEAIAFQRPSGPYSKIFVVDGAGTERDLLQGSAVISAFFPRYSADGTYIYFGARDSSGYAVWRVRPDGSALERIVATISEAVSAPGVSPDGARIAYSDYTALYVLDLATGSKVAVGPPGEFPVISPDGQRLAYFNNAGIAVANSDGTSLRQLDIPRIIKSDAGLAWLPDSKWLITRDWDSPILVNASTAEALTLRSINNCYQIAVKP